MSYTIAEVLPTTKRVDLINKSEFATIALDENAKTFVVYVAALSALTILVHPSCWEEIKLMLADKASTEVPFEYLDYVDVVLFDLGIELPENSGMNKYVIELVEGKEPPYSSIYSLKLVELETLKTYIEIYLKTVLIWPFKTPAGASIFFDQKPDGSVRICINYRGLNNLIIKN